MLSVIFVLALVCAVILLAAVTLRRSKSEDEENKKKSEAAPQSETPSTSASESTSPFGAPRARQNLIMGIDFGTAATKVVVRAPNEVLPSEYVCAVDFGQFSEMEPSCLLQTAIWTDGENVELGRRENFRRVADMKIRLMQDESESVDLAETVAYLAAVIRRAREWFAENNGDWLGGVEEIWRYNIGIPAAIEHEKSRPMRGIYHLVGNAAVMLAESSVPINIRTARDSIQEANSSAQSGNVAFVPEVVAQAVGYAQDQGAIEGLSVIVDVGAWTLDACVFILLDANQGAKARFHVHAAKVENLGCLPLHQKREATIGRSVDFEASRPMPRPEFYSDDEREIEAIRGVDAEFAEECAIAVRWVLGEAKRVAGKEQVFFGRARIPFINCGGGCYAEPFKGVSRKAWDGYVSTGSVYNGRAEQAIHITVPKPQNLDAEGLDDDNYHRFSVAWGLSYPNITYTLPSGTVVKVHSDISRPTFDERGKGWR